MGDVGSFSVYGTKLHMLCSTNRVPNSYELTPANVADIQYLKSEGCDAEDRRSLCFAWCSGRWSWHVADADGRDISPALVDPPLTTFAQPQHTDALREDRRRQRALQSGLRLRVTSARLVRSPTKRQVMMLKTKIREDEFDGRLI